MCSSQSKLFLINRLVVTGLLIICLDASAFTKTYSSALPKNRPAKTIQDPHSIFDSALKLVDKKDFQNACRVFENALWLFELSGDKMNSGISLLNIGKCKYKLVDWSKDVLDTLSAEQSVHYLTSAMATLNGLNDTLYIESALRRAYIYMRLGRYNEAHEVYNRALQYDQLLTAQELISCKYYRGLCSLEEGEFDRALKEFSYIETHIGPGDTIYYDYPLHKAISRYHLYKKSPADPSGNRWIIEDFSLFITRFEKSQEADRIKQVVYAYIIMAECAMALIKHDEAETYLDAGLSANEALKGSDRNRYIRNRTDLLILKGDYHTYRKQWKKAAEIFRTAQPLFDSLSDIPGRDKAHFYFSAGRAYHYTYLRDSADVALNFLRHAAKHAGGDTPLHAVAFDSYSLMGDILQSHEQAETIIKAIEVYQRGFVYVDDLTTDPEKRLKIVADINLNIARCYKRLKQYKDAIDYYQLVVNVRGMMWHEADAVLESAECKEALAESDKAYWFEAFLAYKKIAEVNRAINDTLSAHCYFRSGLCLLKEARPDEAGIQASFSNAEVIFTALGMNTRVSDCWLHLGHSYFRDKSYRAAVNKLRKCLRSGGLDTSQTASINWMMGNAYLSDIPAEADSAERVLIEAVQLYSSMQKFFESAECLHILAEKIYLAEGDTLKAVKKFISAASNYQKSGKEESAESIHLQLSKIHFELKQMEQAKLDVSAALNSGDLLLRLRGFLLLGKINMDLGHNEDSKENFLRVINEGSGAEQGEFKIILAEANLGIGDYYQDKGETDAAHDYYLKSRSLIESLPVRNWPNKFIVELAEKLGSSYLRKGELEPARVILEISKGRDSPGRISALLDSVNYLMNTVEKSQVKEWRPSAEFTEWTGRIPVNQKIHYLIQSSKIRPLPQNYNIENFYHLNYRNFSENTALLWYFPREDSLYIATLTADRILLRGYSVDIHRITSTVDSVLRIIRDQIAFFQELTLSEGAMPVDWENAENTNLKRQLKYLYQILVEPIQDIVAERERLVFCPPNYSGFPVFPFHALVTGFDRFGRPEFLIEKKQVSTVIEFMLERGWDEFRPVTDGTTALFVHNDLELESFFRKQSGGKVKLFLGRNFTPENAKKFAQESSLLFIIAHNDTTQGKQAISFGLNGIWSLEEIPEVESQSLNMVVLCLCSIAEGGIEKYTNIANTFISKGAQSAVSTSWDILDFWASRFVGHFYLNYKRTGDKAYSYQSTLRRMMREPGYGHPAVWAAFYLMDMDFIEIM